MLKLRMCAASIYKSRISSCESERSRITTKPMKKRKFAGYIN
jgi:hypothetical protein